MPSGLCESGEVLSGLRWESPPGHLPHPGPSPSSHLRNCSRLTTDGGLTVHLHGTRLGLVARRELGLRRVLTCQETVQVPSPL